MSKVARFQNGTICDTSSAPASASARELQGAHTWQWWRSRSNWRFTIAYLATFRASRSCWIFAGYRFLIVSTIQSVVLTADVCHFINKKLRSETEDQDRTLRYFFFAFPPRNNAVPQHTKICFSTQSCQRAIQNCTTGKKTPAGESNC